MASYISDAITFFQDIFEYSTLFDSQSLNDKQYIILSTKTLRMSLGYPIYIVYYLMVLKKYFPLERKLSTTLSHTLNLESLIGHF